MSVRSGICWVRVIPMGDTASLIGTCLANADEKQRVTILL